MNERIKFLRKKLGLTLDKFGERLGVTKTTISRLENGVNNVTEQMIKSICREFDVNEGWLRTGEGDPFTEIDEETRLMQWAGRVLSKQDSDFQHRFVKMLMSLTPEQWLLFEEKVNELASNPDNLRKDDDNTTDTDVRDSNS